MIGLGTLSGAALAVTACYFALAARLSSKEIAVVATMGTLSAAGRIAFAAVPSVQPSTVLVMVSGYVFGPASGFLVGATTALVSNLFLGQGPWTVWQMLAWGLVGAASGLLRRLVQHDRTWIFVAFSVVAAIAFGWLMDLWFWLSFISPHSLGTLAAAFASSLWFDILHAAGNALFAALVATRAVAILEGFRSRFHVTYGEAT